MTAANNPTRVVAIGEPGFTQDQIINALGTAAQTDFQLVDVVVPGVNLVADIRSAEPKLVVVDYQTGEQSILDIIDELSLQIADIAVIAIIPGNDPLIAQQVMLAGARAFIVHPFTQINLLSTLLHVRDLKGDICALYQLRPHRWMVPKNRFRPLWFIVLGEALDAPRWQLI